MQVWKFELGRGSGQYRVAMPKGAQLLSVQLQGDVPMLWALCFESAPKVMRRIAVYGTGEEIAQALPFISTVQRGSAVHHYFDLGEA